MGSWEGNHGCRGTEVDGGAAELRECGDDVVWVYARELDEVRGRILGRRPLPSIDEAFAEVRREASRRRVMLGGKKEAVTSGEMPMETVALATKNNPSIDKSSGDQRNNQRKGRLWCSHCNKPGHTRDTCWDIHGKPSNWKSQGSNNGKGFQATVKEKNEDTRASSETNGIYFTKAELEQLQKLSSQPTNVSEMVVKEIQKLLLVHPMLVLATKAANLGAKYTTNDVKRSNDMQTL
ncbi:hypothetical protein RJ640_005141 [Escallonia rubra]|uniref:Uncharacterized protein n=1 Tax=Escallonia rubra TaxID=112253 RepID=A0AA88RYK4_9ASTE|nr:hypothetical protein RJ640_005141 [Escallonia rubra]